MRSPCRFALPWLAALMLLAAPAAQGTSPAPEPDGPKDVLQGNPLHGRQLFVSKGCIECHSVRGAGGRVGPDLGLKVFSKSVYEIAGVLWNHSPFMGKKMSQMGIRRPQFTPEEMLDLISFLYFLNYFDPPGDIRVGRQLWVEKRCADCHSPQQGRTPIGPSLESMENPTTVSLAQSMWNHGTRMLEMLRGRNIEPPHFEGSEMVDLAAHIRQTNRNPRRQLFSLGDPRQGQRLFREKGCASCHAGGKGPDLTDPRFQASVSQITGQMWNHLPRMYQQMQRQGMPFPIFSGEEMNHLISYIYSLAYVGKPGDPRKGAEIYRQKSCFSCHGEPGKGQEHLGPDLATIQSSLVLGALPTMWNHAMNMESRMREKGIAWPRFESEEMADLQAYLRTARSH